MKKQLAILLAALLLSGCGASPPKRQATESGKPQNSQATTAGAETLSLYPAAANLPVGRELKLKATFSPADAGAAWTSSDEAVATVDDGGNGTIDHRPLWCIRKQRPALHHLYLPLRGRGAHFSADGAGWL